MSSCESPGNKAVKIDPVALLAAPPYKGISDSIQQFPDNAALYLERATTLSQHNYHAIASPDYQKAWELTSDPGVALEYISNLMLTDKTRQAVSLLRKSISQFPETTEFSRRLGEVYMETGEPEKAMEAYESILHKDSTDFETWFDKGALLAKLGDTAGAIASMERSFHILPINYSGLALANLYIAGKNPRALELCNILLTRDSSGNRIDPIFTKGVYYSETNQLNEALEQFDECIRRDWKMTDAYIEKGIVLFENKKLTEALAVFTLAATVSNTDADAYFWMGRCYETLGDKEKAAVNYERAFALDRSFFEAWDALKRLKG